MLYIWVVKYIFRLGWATSYIYIYICTHLAQESHLYTSLAIKNDTMFARKAESEAQALVLIWLKAEYHLSVMKNVILLHIDVNGRVVWTCFAKFFCTHCHNLKELPSSSLGWGDPQRVGKGWSCPHPPAPCQTAPRQDSRRSPLHHPFRTGI